MKVLMFSLLVVVGFSGQARASGCMNESFYNLKAIATSVGADYCDAEKLQKIPDPQSMADRQYNYFAEKVNEYSMVLGPAVIDVASLEFMFYPAIRKNALSNEDARKISFSYVQTYSCRHASKSQFLSSTVYVSGIVGLTGVCMSKTKVEW